MHGEGTLRCSGRPLALAFALALAGACSDAPAGGGGEDSGAEVERDAARDLAADFTPPDVTADAADAREDGTTDLGVGDTGDDSGLDAADAADEAVDSAADTPAEQGVDGGGDDAAVDGQPDGGAGCSAAIADLASELYAHLGACTVTVRLDYQTRALLGYQVLCGAYAAVDETSARATAQSDTGYGAAGTMLNAADTEDYFVFYESPGDFGGAAAVSANNGLSTFGGSIVWDGAGDLTWPESWRDPSQLADGCDPSGGFPSSRGWDLAAGSALAEGDVTAALAVVGQTAVPAAFWHGGYVFDAVVLLYPRSVGMFNPATAEWIVMVSGGWLE